MKKFQVKAYTDTQVTYRTYYLVPVEAENDDEASDHVLNMLPSDLRAFQTRTYEIDHGALETRIDWVGEV